MAHILIAEDETAINNLIRSNLKLVGHSCAQAFTGPEALELARSQSFDLVLLDVMLPGLGLSLCFAIARRHGALLEFESKPGHGDFYNFAISFYRFATHRSFCGNR